MAITKTQQIDPAEHAPFNACTCTTNVAVGDLIVAWVEFGAVLPDPNVTNLTVSDNVNPGIYTRLGQQVFGDNNEVDTLFYKIATVAGKPTLTTSTISNTYTGKISCTTFTGFTGTPTPDFNLGLQKTTQASGATTVDVYVGKQTSFANSVGLCQLFVSGTFLQPAPTHWSFGQGQFYIYQIAAAANTSLEVSGTYNGTTTGSGAMFMLADLYDFPGVGDDLLELTNTDLVTHDNDFTYAGEAGTNFIQVGSNGAFCNNQTGGNSVNAFWSGNSFSADQQAQAVLSSLSTGNIFTGGGVGVRYTAGLSGANGYVCFFTGTQYNIYSISNGSLSTLIGGAQARTNNPGDVINLQVKGNVLTLSVNGITLKTVTDNTWTTGSPFITFGGTRPSTVLNTFRAGSLGILAPSYQINTTIGQVGDQVSPALTHQTVAATSSSSPAAEGIAYSLGSLTGTFVEGALVNVINLTGQSASFTEGALTTSITSGSTVQFTAQTAQFAIGPPLDNISYVLDQGATNINLFSQTSTFVEGSIPAVIGPALTAQTVTETVGVPTVSMTLFTFSSQAATFAEGVINAVVGANTATTLGSQSLTSFEGNITSEADYAPTAQTGSFVVGTITFSISNFSLGILGQNLASSEGIIVANVQTPTGTGPPLFIPPQLGKPVTTRTFNWLEMASRAWGSEFRAPDHRIYQFSGGNYKDSTDLGKTGIYTDQQGPADNPPSQ